MLAARRERGDPGARRVPERPTIRAVRGPLYLVLLYEPPTAHAPAHRSATVEIAARGASGTGCRQPKRCAFLRRPRSRGGYAASQGAMHSRSSSTTSGWPTAEGAGVPVLPRAGELRRGGHRRGHPALRHARRLLRLGFGRGVPPRPPASRRRHVKVLSMKEPPARRSRTSSGISMRFPANSSRVSNGSASPSDKMRRELQSAPQALFQQARLDRQLRHAGDSAGRDAGRRFGRRDRPTARGRLDRARSERAFLRPHIADRRHTRGGSAARFSTRRPKRRRRWLFTTAACSRRRTTC